MSTLYLIAPVTNVAGYQKIEAVVVNAATPEEAITASTDVLKLATDKKADGAWAFDLSAVSTYNVTQTVQTAVTKK